jgi:hypothetical protein
MGMSLAFHLILAVVGVPLPLMMTNGGGGQQEIRRIWMSPSVGQKAQRFSLQLAPSRFFPLSSGFCGRGLCNTQDRSSKCCFPLEGFAFFAKAIFSESTSMGNARKFAVSTVRPLYGLKKFSTTIAIHINGLPATSPHGSYSDTMQKIREF